MIFFERVDSADAVSYILYKNTQEIRSVEQNEEIDFVEEDGERQTFELKWLNASVCYQYEYYDKKTGNLKYEIINEEIFNSKDISESEMENYFKYYYTDSIENAVSGYVVACHLLNGLFQEYLKFDFIDNYYPTDKKITLGADKFGSTDV